VRTADDINKLTVPDPNDTLGYVMEAIRRTRSRLHGKTPLIGFAGSPWTLATYMVEGRGSKNFRHIKELIYGSPREAHRLLEKLSKVVSAYLSAQIAAGAQAVQIFDTWGGILTQEAFEEFSLQYIRQVIAETNTGGAPVIVFCKDCAHSVQEIALSGCQMVGLDWATDIGAARTLVGERTALQGNLDPAILYAPPEIIRREVKSILAKFGKGSGHVFNLGHGVLPDTPVEGVKAFVSAVKEESVHYHK
jgi:uroporphyrinogen decarboxylase